MYRLKSFLVLYTLFDSIQHVKMRQEITDPENPTGKSNLSITFYKNPQFNDNLKHKWVDCMLCW